MKNIQYKLYMKSYLNLKKKSGQSPLIKFDEDNLLDIIDIKYNY